MTVDDMNTKDAMHAIYLDWLNNYLTVTKFADDHDMPRSVAEYLIDRGSEIHENRNKPKRVRLNGGVMTSHSAMNQ